ncbi:MAG: hypothetical protein ACO1RT_08635 [Planctomycetaceae bacterium]
MRAANIDRLSAGRTFQGSGRTIEYRPEELPTTQAQRTGMDLLKAPTDNLYKFIALSGMATFALMCVLIHRHTELAISRLLDQGSALLSTGAELETIQMKLKAVAERPATLAQPSDAELYKSLDDAEVGRLFASLAKAEALQDQFNTYNDFYPLFLELYMTVAVLGLSIAALGFYLWYRHLQRHLDLKLAHEVSKLRQAPSKPNRGFWHGYRKE